MSHVYIQPFSFLTEVKIYSQVILHPCVSCSHRAARSVLTTTETQKKNQTSFYMLNLVWASLVFLSALTHADHQCTGCIAGCRIWVECFAQPSSDKAVSAALCWLDPQWNSRPGEAHIRSYSPVFSTDTRKITTIITPAKVVSIVLQHNMRETSY